MKTKAYVVLSLIMATTVSQVSAATLDSAHANNIISHVKQSLDAQHSTGCVAVVDAGGTLLAFQRFDKASPGCVDAAIGKARTSALYHAPSLKFMQRLQSGETTVLAIPHALALGGGYPLTEQDEVVGAVGVSTPIQTLDNQASEAAAKAFP